MSTATAAPRSISFGTLLVAVFQQHLRAELLSRKTIFLAMASLLPVIGAALYLANGGRSGVDFYTGLMDNAVVFFLLPLVCLFYGGPAVVSEIEGRTLTYLFLRPVSKPAIFLGKVLSSTLCALVVMVPPVVLTFVLCMSAGANIGDNIQFGLQTFVSTTLGCVVYVVIFAALGALFARSILGGVLYWGLVEVCVGWAPVLEFATMKFHLRNVANLIDFQDVGTLESWIVGPEPIVVPIWASFIVLGVVLSAVLVVGAWVFNGRQYIV